jgi:CRISPR-associated protein Cmx8
VSEGPEAVTVEYDLFALPTAFHKAGLAGLVLLIRSLEGSEGRGVLKEGEAKYEMSATTLSVTFTEPLVQRLFDDVYDARVVEVFSKTKWQGTDPKREESVEETVNGKQVKTKRFVYDQVQPCGAFFDTAFDGDKEVWRKLWRDMLWNIARGRPLTRIPFNERSEGKSCGEGATAWEALLKVHKARGRSEFYTTELSSALFPGAQAVNAEGVPFDGRAEENLLLHFWPLVCPLFVPSVIEADGSSDFVGYTIAVPEVADLIEFVRLYPLYLDHVTKNTKVRGYRPAAAVVDLAAEGGLAVLDRMAELTTQKVEGQQLTLSVSAVEYLHLVKIGNNVKSLAAGRVSPNPDLLRSYHSLVCPKPGVDPVFRNPLFRRGLLFALLNTEAGWFRPFTTVFQSFDVKKVLVRPPRRPATEEDEAQGLPQFAADAATQFRHLSRQHAATLERMKSMPDAPTPPTPLPVIVNRVVRTYVLARTQEKSGVRLEAFENEAEQIDWNKVPAEFNEVKNKLALGLMLEFRSRKEQAFAEHFAATFFSVTQRLSEPDRLRLAEALTTTEQRDDLKTLTLLSLSANS